MNRFRLLALLLFLALLLSAPALAQFSPHFDLDWSLLSGGGGLRGSDQYQIDDVLGQWPDGRSSSANHQLDPGFWTAGRLAEPARLYLPLVVRTRH